MRTRPAITASLTVFAGAVALSVASTDADQPLNLTLDQSKAIEFNRHVRPILSDRCWKCHGPDSAARQANLRLDSFEAATALRQDRPAAIVPGDPDASLLIQRITSHDPTQIMPPVSEHRPLNADEIDVLREWITEGAAWQTHWSFIPPVSPRRPNVADRSWAENEIDTFILAQLEAEGLEPESEADRETIIRRVTLGLTGLPPMIEEVDAFLADDAPGAYGRVVDRLLASPRYGEHMARSWLDAARYGDTHGLHLDNYRSIWRWRDWVIRAFNENMPFDQFTIEQLAGDLLPDPTTEQLIATGFNRNNVTTSEGGAIDAEYLVEYAVDRVKTTATVWMGLTAECAQCHDHKFDPISQHEFYELFAFFNNVEERAMDGNAEDPPPVIRAPSATERTELERLRAAVAAARAQTTAPHPEIDGAQREWEEVWRETARSAWTTLTPSNVHSTAGATLTILDDGSVLASGSNPAQDVYELTLPTDETGIGLLRIEALTDESLPHRGPGRAENANFVLSEIEAEVISRSDPSVRQTVSFTAAAADHEQMNGPYLVEHAIDGVLNATNGWAIEGFARREDRQAVFVSDRPFGYEGGSDILLRLRFETQFAQHAIGRARISVSTDNQLIATISPARRSVWMVAGPFDREDNENQLNTEFAPELAMDEGGVIDVSDESVWTEREFADGSVHMLEGEQCATYLYRTLTAPSRRPVRLLLGSDDSMKVWLNGQLVLTEPARRAVGANQNTLEVVLQPGENTLLLKIVNYAGDYGFYFQTDEGDERDELVRILAVLSRDDEARTDADQARIREYFRTRHSPGMRALYDALAELTREESEYTASLPVTMVMREREERRPAFVLKRGQYDQPLDEVQPDVPDVLPALGDRPRNRLGLAMWLVDPAHPLTARVIVNRVWQHHFGRGIVATPEDFGSQGAWPSHTDLLDWLAVEFVESGWDLQHIHRLIVTSATYRQDSRISSEKMRVDPQNTLLSRGARFRLDAEVIRDQALAASGLLVEKVGGPSVKPYQPSGIWRDVAYPDSNTRTFQADDGPAQHRRSIYTFWKRTAPPPNLAAFDAPSRETCTVRRPRTNTPLQMLVLFNDPQFLEAAAALAERVVDEAGTKTSDRIIHLMRLCTGRMPTQTEIAILEETLRQIQARLGDGAQARALLREPWRSNGDGQVVRELAAWTMLANVVLSLDEVITRP